MWIHIVARACTPQEPFKEAEFNHWAWTKLSKIFPDAIAAVLMPNHLHLILPKQSKYPPAIERLGGFLGAISKQKYLKKLWQPIPTPTEIADLHSLRRQVRYLALNPCRKRLCSDPLEWYWSTYRELMGASIEEFRNAALLAQILGETDKGFKVRFHSYVSGDPTVSVVGTPFPTSSKQKIWAEESVSEILAAAAGALRLPPMSVQKKGPLRSLLIHLAYRHGWNRPTLLAHLCRMTRRGVHKIQSNPPPEGLEVADLCLGDLRLRPKVVLAEFLNSEQIQVTLRGG